LHIILIPTNLPLPRGGAAGGGVLSMRLHMEMVLAILSIAQSPHSLDHKQLIKLDIFVLLSA